MPETRAAPPSESSQHYQSIQPLDLRELRAEDGLDGDICLEIAVDACDWKVGRIYLTPGECDELMAWMRRFMEAYERYESQQNGEQTK